MKHNIRCVKVMGATYLRIEDVAAYILELSSGEETDVRNRLKEGANNLLTSHHEIKNVF